MKILARRSALIVALILTRPIGNFSTSFIEIG
jgi:hypothetical protein